MSHIHLIILISVCWSVNSFCFFTGHVSLPCNIQLHTQLLHNITLIRSEMMIRIVGGSVFLLVLVRCPCW